VSLNDQNPVRGWVYRTHGFHWGSIVHQTSERVALCFYGLRLGWLHIGRFCLRRSDCTRPDRLPEKFASLLPKP